MAATLTFGEILDAADELPLDAQRELAAILARRVSDARRQALLERVAEAEEDYRQGRCRTMTPEEFAAELAT